MLAPPQLRLPDLSWFSKGAHSLSRKSWGYPSCFLSLAEFHPRVRPSCAGDCILQLRLVWKSLCSIGTSGNGPYLHFSHDRFVHQHRATLSSKIMRSAAPPPLPGFEHQRCSHRVLVNVVELLLALLIGADYEI